MKVLRVETVRRRRPRAEGRPPDRQTDKPSQKARTSHLQQLLVTLHHATPTFPLNTDISRFLLVQSSASRSGGRGNERPPAADWLRWMWRGETPPCLGGGRFEGLGGGEHGSDFGHQILKRQDINR